MVGQAAEDGRRLQRAGALAERAAELVQAEAPALLRSTCVPGMSVCITSPGGALHTVVGGIRELGRPEPVRPETVFQIGSVSKSISAIGAVRMGPLGLMGLDEPVVDRLRTWRFPERMTREHDPSVITLRWLLSHTAGLNVHGYPYVRGDRALPGAGAILDGVDGPDYTLGWRGPPGETMHYSSAHFVMLQLLIEEVTGEPFAAWMERNLLLPLGMLDSSYLWDERMRPKFAMRHTGEGQVLPQLQRAVLASSNLHTTATDLARCLRLMLAARTGDHTWDWFMPPELALEMTRPQPRDQAEREERHWGLGWYLGAGHQATTFKAGGAFEGVWCWLEAFPATGVCVVMLTNSQSGAHATHPLMAKLRPFLLTPEGVAQGAAS